MSDIVVKESKIKGKGVFANRDFKKGEVVNEWSGKVLSEKEFQELSEEEKIYCSKYSENQWILFGSPDRYFNHSCDANTTPGKHCEIAKRDIKKGEELTVDYDAEDAAGESFTCHCKSKNCKGTILKK